MGLKISCASLAFSDVAWDEALAKIKELGFRYADLAMFEGWTHVSPSRLADPETHGKKIGEVCGTLGLEPIAIHANFKPAGVKSFPGLTTPDVKARKTVLEHFARVVRCARAAQVPLVNVQPGKFIDGLPAEACLENAIAALRAMHQTAAAAGVTLSFENHTGSIGERPEQMLALLEGVPGLRLDYDFSHLVANGIAIADTRPVLKYVSHAGVRNARPGSYNEPLLDGKMSYDLKAFVDVLRTADVDACVSVEYYQPEKQSEIPKLKRALESAGLSASRAVP